MRFISILENGNRFDKLVKDKPAFVKFFHPMCHYCTEMAPEWNALKEILSNKNDNVNIIEVHSDAISDIKSDCVKNIPGYPTIMEVKKNGKAGREFKGERTKDNLKKFFLKTFEKELIGGNRRKTNRRKTNRRKTNRRKTNRRKTNIKA